MQHPSLIGFEEVLNLLSKPSAPSAYPPYNIVELSSHDFRIEIALAGSGLDINITRIKDTLVVSGEVKDGPVSNYLHKGISTKGFKREFVLSPDVQVKDAQWDNGLLVINLLLVTPEKDLPEKIEITQSKQFLTE